MLVTLATLHHHRRTRGAFETGVRLLGLTVLATVALTAYACALVIVRG